jgi:hypothetical protein
MIAAAPKRAVDVLTDAALTDLITEHGSAIATADLPWLGGVLAYLRLGYSLAPDQIARVARIRGDIAKRYHHSVVEVRT